jgi:hypothetical protein
MFQKMKLVAAIPANTAAGNTPLVSSIIDRNGYSGPVTFVITSGVLTTGGATYTPSLEHGDAANLSDTAAPSAAQLEGALADATFGDTADNAVFHFGYNGPKRYVRLTITPAGSTGNASLAAVACLTRPVFSSAAAMP